MGPSDAARRVDHELEEIQASYDLLELLHPTNVDEAWEEFRSGGFAKEPAFDYPEIPVDPEALLKRLHVLDFQGVEDASLLYFLTAKRNELELEIRLLRTRNTPAFLATSICMYGPVQQELLREAEQILDSLDPQETSGSGEVLSSDEVRALVDDELDYYRSRDSSFSAEVRVRADQEGFLAEEGDLMFPEDIRLPLQRAQALVQHEIGVHIVTYHNGSKQPLALLRSGLSSYDELQEALGALSEHLVGGLTATRMRTLAARSLAARMTEQRTCGWKPPSPAAGRCRSPHGIRRAWSPCGSGRGAAASVPSCTSPTDRRWRRIPSGRRPSPTSSWGFLVEHRVGPLRLFLNAENILDTRQTRYDPLVLPARFPAGRCDGC